VVSFAWPGEGLEKNMVKTLDLDSWAFILTTNICHPMMTPTKAPSMDPGVKGIHPKIPKVKGFQPKKPKPKHSKHLLFHRSNQRLFYRRRKAPAQHAPGTEAHPRNTRAD
jgi:hypothetical protein